MVNILCKAYFLAPYWPVAITYENYCVNIMFLFAPRRAVPDKAVRWTRRLTGRRGRRLAAVELCWPGASPHNTAAQVPVNTGHDALQSLSVTDYSHRQSSEGSLFQVTSC